VPVGDTRHDKVVSLCSYEMLYIGFVLIRLTVNNNEYSS